MQNFYENSNGKIINGDNIEVMKTIADSSVDSCISDFPYSLSFMGKSWDTQGNFYEWCKLRAIELFRIMKPGGYVCIFGHPKTNHRMKCALEDSGFNIVEEIDWIYLSGFPKNQDIGKLFDKKAGVERKVIGKNDSKGIRSGASNFVGDDYKCDGYNITTPTSDLAKQWNGWKTSGLKPAHEPITIFQKPLEGTYINNIEKYGCGAMNIDACRVPTSQSDIEMINAKASKNPTDNYNNKDGKVYGDYEKNIATPANLNGRFPPNMMFCEDMAKLLDEQTGIKQSKKSMRGIGYSDSNVFGNGDANFDTERGFNDVGGGSKMFPIFKYCPKVNPKERLLPNSERNPHVTVKPKELIKWLIKLVTPKDGLTIDITAGSCTHGVATEELNRDEGYSLKWVNIEWMNTESEPYCETGKMRIENISK